jgi:probable F420-dependent oxidoreductase
MHFGASMFCTDYSMPPAELAPALEDRGFESFWAPEHSHIPTSRISPWGGGAELPKRYYDVIDPFVGLATAAVTTKKLKLGTGVCLIIQRDPIQLAKEVATLDLLSGGRFLFGIGAGWNLEEMADHGTDPRTRIKLMAERVSMLKTIWTETKPEFKGEFQSFEPMMTWPKPVQKPHPPVLVGGAMPHAARRAIAYGDGWIPLGGRGADVVGQLPLFRQMATEAGRDADSLPVSIFGAEMDEDRLKQYRDAGIERVVFSLEPEKTDEVLPVLDKIAGLIQTVN